MSPADLRRRVLDARLHRYTPDTRGTATQLRAVLAEVCRQGQAVPPGVRAPDVLGVVAPVSDARGEVVAALAVIVPTRAGVPLRSSVVGVTARPRVRHPPA